MGMRVSDILKLPAFKNAAVKSGSDSLDRMVSSLTDEIWGMREGTLFVFKNSELNMNSVISAHPEAAGFVISEGAGVPSVRADIPLISLPARDMKQLNALYDTLLPSLALEYFMMLQTGAKKETAELLSSLKKVTGMDYCLRNEADGSLWLSTSKAPMSLNKRQKDAVLPRTLLEGEVRILQGDMEVFDAYMLESAANALMAAAALYNAKDREAAVIRLIREGETQLAEVLCRNTGMRFPKDADVWLLVGETGAAVRPWIKSIREFCSAFGNVYFLEEADNDLIAVVEKHASHRTEMQHAGSLAEYCQRSSMPLTLIRGTTLYSRYKTLRVIRSLAEETLEDARRVYPARIYYNASDLALVQQCRKIIHNASSSYRYYLNVLDRLGRSENEYELIDTLAVYFLDQGMSITDTSAVLFVHRNTIKYRMQRAEDILGLDAGNASDIYELVISLVINRLIRK